jgi:hypothetical protein
MLIVFDLHLRPFPHWKAILRVNPPLLNRHGIPYRLQYSGTGARSDTLPISLLRTFSSVGADRGEGYQLQYRPAIFALFYFSFYLYFLLRLVVGCNIHPVAQPVESSAQYRQTHLQAEKHIAG